MAADAARWQSHSGSRFKVCGGPLPGFEGALLAGAGHGARQAAHSWAAAGQAGAQDAERRAAGLGRQAPHSERPEWADEAREYRLVLQSMALIEAAEKKDWEMVKVRRPLEAVSSTEYGPSQAARLKLGQWTLDAVVARPIRPCCAESSPYVRQF